MTTRIGHAWTKQEEDSILADIEAGLRIAEIAVKQQRTTGGIRTRLTRLACSFVEDNKMSLYEAAGRTGIRVARIQEALKRKTEQEATKKPTAMEFKFTKTTSREELLNVPHQRKIAHLQSIVDRRIAPHVQVAADRGKTSYLCADYTDYILTHEAQTLNAPLVTMSELVEAVRAKFPGCKVEYTEDWVDYPRADLSQPPTRIRRAGIKIDWS